MAEEILQCIFENAAYNFLKKRCLEDTCPITVKFFKAT